MRFHAWLEASLIYLLICRATSRELSSVKGQKPSSPCPQGFLWWLVMVSRRSVRGVSSPISVHMCSTKRVAIPGGVPQPTLAYFACPCPTLLCSSVSPCSLQIACAGYAGWYDGSEWFKPPDIRARDEMLNNYEVQPAVDRLKA